MRCTAVFDATGRFNPTFDESQVEDIPADSIIFAIGQTSDLSFLDPADGVESERGLIKVNRETYQTTAPDVFACGDIAHGPRLFIDAIASAQIAARSMHDFLRGTRTEVVVRKQWMPAAYTMADGWNTIRARAIRRCWRANSARPRSRSSKRPYRRGRRPPPGLALPALQRQYGLRHREMRGLQRLRGRLPGEPDPPGARRPTSSLDADADAAVMLKDETTCIRCALCASRCPTHAITMKRFDFYTECVTVETRNPKVNYGTTRAS